MKNIYPAAIGVAMLAAFPASAQVYTLGEQDFADGEVPTLSGFNDASVGEAAPFDIFRGTDVLASNPFAATFTFSYAPTSVSNASLTFGLFDSDSGEVGLQVNAFQVNGVDFTAEMNTIFESKNSLQSQVSLFTFNLPASTLAGLSSGTASFFLRLQGPSFVGQLPGNGAGLDFARLTLNGGGAVPEPGTWALLILGFGLVGGALRRRSTQAGVRRTSLSYA